MARFRRKKKSMLEVKERGIDSMKSYDKKSEEDIAESES